ncbi:hypothetical protein Peur_026627 [Populus x canadensis]
MMILTKIHVSLKASCIALILRFTQVIPSYMSATMILPKSPHGRSRHIYEVPSIASNHISAWMR